ncbi:Enhancer of polycomb-like protein 1 [Serendipita sp. 401]|nr:Enhancer of polycomb-like protein 1 [Serendipita sp. 401]
MPRNEQPKSSTLRSRQRITNKTRLRVVHGSIDAETVTIGEDDGRGVLHSTQGVEAEDAAEHHLQQVLNAANNSISTSQKQQRSPTADGNSQVSLAPPPPPPEANFIPTPDAQGIVANYDELYSHKKHEMSYAILKFSDSVEECLKYGLAGRSYTMDERDALWLDNWNQQARGEGTSTGSTRRTRVKGAEVDEDRLPVIDEDWFELCMGLLEKISSEQFPFLHIDQSYPPFSFFEPLLSQPYAPSLFASCRVPAGLPKPEDLTLMAKYIYPHWAERKKERRGRSIIPDINFDEADDGNVYVCFRRREVKPTRKTRRMETTSIDKLTRLSVEFQSALQLANKAIEREETKRKICAENKAIWSLRSRMVSITSKYPDLRNAEDDKWLVDKEKKPPLPHKIITQMPHPARAPISGARDLDPLIDLGPPLVHPRKRNEDILYKIEQDVQKRKEKEVLGWNDTTDVPLQPSIPTSQRYFRVLNGTEISEGEAPKSTSQPSSFRHRVGRGGRRYLDRRLSPFTTAPLTRRASTNSTENPVYPFGLSTFRPLVPLKMHMWTGFPHSHANDQGADQQSQDEDTEDLVKRMEDRWKFDPDSTSSNLDPEGRPIIDDFDYRQSLQRHILVKDRDWLITPDTSRIVADLKLNLIAPLQDALSVHGEHQLHQLQQAAMQGMQSQVNGSMQPRVPVVNGTPIRAPNAPPSLPSQPAIQRSPLPNVPTMILPQQNPKPQVQSPVQPGQSQVSNSAVQLSPVQLNGTPQATPVQSHSSPMTNGTPTTQNGSFTAINGGSSSPPKPVTNGTYHVSPAPSPLPPSANIIAPDAGTTVRVSTPIRKPTLPLQPGGNLQVNGFHGLQHAPNGFPTFPNGVAAEMFNSLQSMKVNQQHMLPYQQPQIAAPLTPQQQQYIQQQQQQQHLRQLHLMQMQAANNGAVPSTHFTDPMNQHMMMSVQPTGQVLHAQNMFQMGMPGINNSAMNMTVQNMNLQLGQQNLALRMPPNRIQQQQIATRPATATGTEFSMTTSPMMHSSPGMGMSTPMNPQMVGATISRAPSTPLSMRNGLLPNGGMMMARTPGVGAMQSPMMRPSSAASMHSNMGMPMQPGQSLPVSLQGSPANMHQPPLTPHLRQQPVPSS